MIQLSRRRQQILLACVSSLWASCALLSTLYIFASLVWLFEGDYTQPGAAILRTAAYMCVRIMVMARANVADDGLFPMTFEGWNLIDWGQYYFTAVGVDIGAVFIVVALACTPALLLERRMTE